MNAHTTLIQADNLREYEALMQSFGENPKIRLSKPITAIAMFWLSSGR